MTNYLTEKQLKLKNEGYNSNRAGESIIKFCVQARAKLYDQLVKPSVNDESAFEAYITAKVNIRKMDFNDLRHELNKIK